MTYFCFIESNLLSVPHMEPLDAECPTRAASEARRLLQEHASGTVAHVFKGGAMITSIQRAELELGC